MGRRAASLSSFRPADLLVVAMLAGLPAAGCMSLDSGTGAKTESETSDETGSDSDTTTQTTSGDASTSKSEDESESSSTTNSTKSEESDSGEDSGDSTSDETTASETASEESTSEESTSEESTSEDSTTPSDTTSETTDTEITGDVEFSFLTVTYDALYAPNNVGAVWIEDASGNYLKTLNVWAGVRKRHLVNWRAASANDPTAVDAISGATIEEHETHEASWDRTDVEGNTHGAGDYLLRLEFTETHDDDASKQISVPFTLGEGAQTLTPPDENNFESISIKLPG